MQEQASQIREVENAELIGHGAEAKVWKVLDGEGKATAVKVRLPKKYRHPKLDSRINTARVKSESKILQKVLSKNIDVPKVVKCVVEENKIVMEYIEGDKLKDLINKDEEKIQQILTILADIIYRLHQLNIIHGDLTTSNMIYSDKKIFLLDFGLACTSASVEDKAVDLYLFEKAFMATHPHLQGKFSLFLEKYGVKSILDRLEVVRQRGRKKITFG